MYALFFTPTLGLNCVATEVIATFFGAWLLAAHFFIAPKITMKEVFIMKRILALLLALSMLFMFTACDLDTATADDNSSDTILSEVFSEEEDDEEYLSNPFDSIAEEKSSSEVKSQEPVSSVEAYSSEIPSETESINKETVTQETITSEPVQSIDKPAESEYEPDLTDPEDSIIVYITATGKRYHYENPCGRGKYTPTSLANAKRIGLTPCEKCVLH